MNSISIFADSEFDGVRIDKYLSVVFPDLSRSFIQKAIDCGNVSVNGKTVAKNYKLKTDERIEYIPLEPVKLEVKAQNIPLDIVYEDDDLLVVNKPKGMVVHPAPGNYENTLVNALLFHCKDSLSGINGVLRPGIVHRIDRDTTGSVIACKNDKAHRCIAEQLKEHSINRRYRAICFGELKQEEGTIDQPIGRHPNDRKKMAVNPQNGKRAVTHYRVLQRFQGYTYIECVLETGRTHQIRVHLTSVGLPLLGDPLYRTNASALPDEAGVAAAFNRQALHASRLILKHPSTGETCEWFAPPPEDMCELMEALDFGPIDAPVTVFEENAAPQMPDFGPMVYEGEADD